MNKKDVMIELKIVLLRDGTIGLERLFPSGNVHCDKALAIGILDIAQSMVRSELKDGEAP